MKSFPVVAPSAEEKADWMREIESSVRAITHPRKDSMFSTFKTLNIHDATASEPEMKTAAGRKRSVTEDSEFTMDHSFSAPVVDVTITGDAVDDDISINSPTTTTTTLPSSPTMLGDMPDLSGAASIAISLSGDTVSSPVTSPRKNQMSIKTAKGLAADGVEVVSLELFVGSLQFSQSILQGKNTTYKASDSQKLMMYGFFKQSTVGDCNTGAPPDDKTGLNKWKAWVRVKGMEKEASMSHYVHIVDRLTGGREVWKKE